MSEQNVGGIKGSAELDTSKFEGGIKKMQAATEQLNPAMKRTEKGLRDVENAARGGAAGAETLGGSMKKLLPSLTAANLTSRLLYDALVKIRQGAEFAFTAPLANARSFETKMAQVSTVVKASKEEVQKLGKEVLEMSKRFPKTKEELGAGLYQILQSGIEKSADAMKVLEVSAEAAIGGVTEIDVAAKVLTDTINAYGLSAADATELADIMFVGARMGTAEFADLAGALGNVNSTAALAGVTVNEVVAGIEAMSLAGISADEGATALNRLMLSVIDPSDQVIEAVAGIQKEFKDFEFSAQALKEKGLQQFMKELAEVVGDNTQLMVLLTEDVRAFKAAAVIAGEGAGNFTKILEATRNEEGALREAFLKNADTVDNLLVVAWNNFIATITEAGQEHLPELKEKIGDIIEILETNEQQIFNTAMAFTDALVGAMQVVVENAPAIIDAMGKVANAVSLAASALGQYLEKAGMVGESVVGFGLRVKGQVTRNLDDMEMANEISASHARGELHRTTQERQRQEFLKLSNANQALADQNMERQLQMRQLQAGGPLSAQDQATFNKLASGMSMDDILAEELKSTKKRITQKPKTGSSGGGGGGGGAREARDLEKALRDIEKVEKDILDAVGDQAKANRDRMEQRRDELLLLERMGMLTEKEGRELDRINGRVEFQEDKIKDATKAWEDQVDALKKVEDRIKEITQTIQDEYDELQKTVADIDKDATKRKGELAGELIRERDQLLDKTKTGQSLSGDESRRLGEIDSLLATAGTEALAEGEDLSKLNEFQLIDREAEARKKEAAEKQAARAEELTAELAAEQQKLDSLRRAEAEKRQIVISALDERTAATKASYDKIEKDTDAHVAAMVEKLNNLKAKYQELTNVSISSVQSVTDETRREVAPGFARGGPIVGPGTGTSDSILARLSDGEHVLTAADVRAMGGQGAVLAFREAIHSGMRDLPRFAQGGPVTNDHSKSANITIHNHGRAAEVYADPRRARWHARTFLG